MNKREQEEFRKRLLAPLERLRANNLNASDENFTSGSEINETSNQVHMSLNQYVSNPTGKGSGYVAKRAAIKQRIRLNFHKTS